MRAEQVTDPVAEHGEGPVWWPAWGGLCWVDMLRGDVLRLTGPGPVERWHVGSVAAALRPRGATGMVLALERAFATAERFGGEVSTLASGPTESDVRFNEGACDPAGNFLCGTMSHDAAPGRGRLYRLRTDHRVELVLAGVTISNGLAWSPDATCAYYVDSATGRVDVFDHREGDLRGRRPFVTVPVHLGTPDGLTVDNEGGVWVALWNGGAVHRYDPAGHLTAVVPLPVTQVTACTFGGPDLGDLYVTTSRLGEPVAGRSAAGALFQISPGVSGLPAVAYRG